MITFNFQLRRVNAHTVQLPQFNVLAAGLMEAIAKVKIILGHTVNVEGEVTDGDHVWDFKTGEML